MTKPRTSNIDEFVSWVYETASLPRSRIGGRDEISIDSWLYNRGSSATGGRRYEFSAKFDSGKGFPQDILTYSFQFTTEKDDKEEPTVEEYRKDLFSKLKGHNHFSARSATIDDSGSINVRNVFAEINTKKTG